MTVGVISLAVPGSAAFAGEFLILAGSFQRHWWWRAREALLNAIPASQKHAIACGIGFFLAMLGLLACIVGIVLVIPIINCAAAYASTIPPP